MPAFQRGIFILLLDKEVDLGETYLLNNSYLSDIQNCKPQIASLHPPPKYELRTIRNFGSSGVVS